MGSCPDRPLPKGPVWTRRGWSLAYAPGVRHSGQMPQVPWANCFVDPDYPERPATIQLQQVTRKSFRLESSLRYTGPTGVPNLPDAARTLRPADLGDPPTTDLASVPSPLRWFVSTYDVHTPAALIHDRLIGPTNNFGVADADADRFFRFMLKELGVRFLRRWMMWTAVAFGTRWRSKQLVVRLSLVIWLILAATGIAAFVYGLLTLNWWLVLVAVIAPIPVSLLWGRQYGAGLTAAAVATWVLPPTALATVGYWIYWLLEKAISLLPIHQDIKGNEPVGYKHF